MQFPNDLLIFALPSVPGKRRQAELFGRRMEGSTNTCGHCGSLECGYVRGLADWIGEETDGDACLEIPHLYFRLYCRIALQAGNGNQVHVIERQLA